MKKHLLLTLLFLTIFSPAVAGTSAPIIMYHRIGDDRYPTTNTTVEQLEQQVQEINRQVTYYRGAQTGDKAVPLTSIIDYFNRGESLPDGVMAITVDDAFESFYKNGFPIFQQWGMPFTLFVSAGEIDKNLPDYMTWDQLREITKSPLATIGHHGYSHKSFLDMTPDQLRDEIRKANTRFQEELGFVPELISYPYGEHDETTLKVVREFSFHAGFSQTSGVADAKLDRFDLPRFPLNENYGDIDRFKLIINAKPLSMKLFEPQGPFLDTTTPDIRFEISPDFSTGLDENNKAHYNADHLQCYAAGSPRPMRLIKDTTNERAFTGKLLAPLPYGRPRINCTLSYRGQWYWFGKMYYLNEPEN